MPLRSLAVVLVLALLAAAGIAGVRELTREPMRRVVLPIRLDPNPGAETAAPKQAKRRERKTRRSRDRERRGGFDPPPSTRPQQPAPESPPPAAAPPPPAPVPPSGEDEADGSETDGDDE